MAISLHEIEILRRLPLFQGLRTEAIYDLLGDAVVRSHPRRATLFVQGEPADRFFVVLVGWVKLYRQSPSGEEAVIEVFGPGESFAEAAMLGDGRYPVSAEIVDDARLLEVPADPFRRRLQEDAKLAFNMLSSMSWRLKDFVRRTEQARTYDTAQRVALFLLRFCRVECGAARIRLPYEKLLIAGRLGMKPETFSRALARLGKLGVRTSGQEVQVPDVGSLRDFAEGRAR